MQRKSHSVATPLMAFSPLAYHFDASSHHLHLQVHVKWDGATLANNKALSFIGTLKDRQGTVVCMSPGSGTARR